LDCASSDLPRTVKENAHGGVPVSPVAAGVQGDAVSFETRRYVTVLESSNPGQVVAVASGLLGLAALLIRSWVRVALARQQRRAMTAVATALAVEGRSARARQRGRGGEWSIEFDVRQELPDRGRDVSGSQVKGGPAR
jgi:hypothetical protein